MGKSRADIQKAYRERKKEKEGSRYLENERKRVRKYFIPIDEQSTSSKKIRRDKVRQHVREHRARVRLQENNDINNDEDEETSASADGNNVSSSTGADKLMLNVPAFDPKNRTRKRIARATSKHHRELDMLRQENEKLKKRVKTVSKRNERLIKSVSTTERAIGNSETCTTAHLSPRKRVSTELTEIGVSPSKIPRSVKKTLIFAHVMTDEIKTARKENGHKGKNMIARILSGKLVKKYRMKRNLNKHTGISRQTRCSTKKCDTLPKIHKRMQEREELRNAVHGFLLQDENSRMMPGKNDKVKEASQLKQKRVLNDNMSFLHLKFKSETNKKISFATFCRMRPKSICLTRYITKNQCLCQKHQNMALTLKSMKSAGAHVPINPDEYVRKLEENTLDDYTEDISDTIHHQQWQKVTLNDGKKRTKVVGKDITKDDFMNLIKKQTDEFKDHVFRIKKQYKAMIDLKENITEEHVIIMMDFAENFSCSSADEVQSAYWNSNAVTVHPVVVYYKDDGVMKHTNCVFVSDDLGHNIGTVYAILKKLIPEVKETVKGVKKVFYWTDSPSSQYRNKTSFYIVSAHKELLNTEAEWNFWETGHGKGACDGVGGTAKRMADINIRQGKVSVQDATDFFNWGNKYHTSAKYIFVTEDECTAARSEVDAINTTLIPIKGTMKVHHAFSTKSGTINTRITSCYCDSCIVGNYHDETEHKLLKLKKENSSMPEESTNIEHGDQSNTLPIVNDEIDTIEAVRDIVENSWVVVVYENQWHVGQVVEVDKVDQDCLVSFMRKTNVRKNSNPAFKWPSPPDKIWVKFQSVLMEINEPTKIGRSCRSFELLEVEIEHIGERFKI